LSPSDIQHNTVAGNFSQESLLNRARDAAKSAYVPYSEFPVGAAILTSSGRVYTGGNIENASYGLTVCAERTAVFAAVNAGELDIIAVAVSAPRGTLTTPCGACRQVLNEFRSREHDMQVVLDDGASGLAIPLTELLPRAFGPADLENMASGDDAG
jgi:cytidine deaminase